MRGQTKNAAQIATIARLTVKGWREGDMMGKQVPMFYDRPFPEDGIPCPHMIHVDRRGQVHRGQFRGGPARPPVRSRPTD